MKIHVSIDINTVCCLSRKSTYITMDLNFVCVVSLVDNCTLQCEHGSLQKDTCSCTGKKNWTGYKCGMLLLYEIHI